MTKEEIEQLHADCQTFAIKVVGYFDTDHWEERAVCIEKLVAEHRAALAQLEALRAFREHPACGCIVSYLVFECADLADPIPTQRSAAMQLAIDALKGPSS